MTPRSTLQYNGKLARRRQHAPTNIPFGSVHIDAVIAAVTGSDPHRAGQPVADVSLHIDCDTLVAGRHAGTICETVDGVPVPVSTVHRMCCEAVVAAVLIDADGVTQRLCAEQRTANREQRRALAAMYATCAHPHCDTSFTACRIHHVIWWSNGGNTVLDNLVPLCEEHHHLVHEGGWNLTLQPDRTLTWIRPDGHTWCRTSTNRKPDTTSAGPAPPDTRPLEPADWHQPSLC